MKINPNPLAERVVELEEKIKKCEFAIIWLLLFTVFIFGMLIGFTSGELVWP
jgi:hypothetical protein